MVRQSQSGRQTAAPTAGISLDADNGAPPAKPSATRPAALPKATQRLTVAKPKPTATAVPAKMAAPAKYLVLFVLDGAQPDYYDVPGIPHIKALMKNGADYSNGFAGILESETPSGHAAIASGSQPRADGILSFAWANSDNTTVNLFDPKNIQNGQMERIIGDAPASDIAELVHRQDHKAKVVVLGGHKYYAQDALGGPSADVIAYYTGTPQGTFAPIAVPGHVPPPGVLEAPGLVAKSTHLPMGTEDTLVMRLVHVAVQKMQPRVLMVNVPEFDWPLGHVDGADRDPAGVRTLMQGFDRDLGALEDQYRRAGILNQTLFVLTSDHGFAPIYHTVDSKQIEKAATDTGTAINSDTFHTAGYMWLQDHTKAAAAAENVAKLQNPYIQSVYFKEPAAKGGYEYVRATGPDLFHVPAADSANQYLLHTFSGPNGPDVCVFFTENTASLPGGESSWKGDHGGATWNSQHLRIIFSGPGVRPGTVSSRPAPLMDIAPTALTLMGIAPDGMQGVPLADGMLNPTTAVSTASQSQSSQLQPVISALSAESRAEIAAGR
ncbi:MAG: alkaline phosphatase family protein [Chloroflexota bacterium]